MTSGVLGVWFVWIGTLVLAPEGIWEPGEMTSGNGVRNRFMCYAIPMGRALRTDIGGYVYHVLNRANARAQIFDTHKDYELFENILEEATEREGMRILSYCLMPNHWHLVLYPQHDGEMSRFMNWVTLTHTQRWHVSKGTTGQGHVYQGRYKSFLCQDDEHFLTLVRYVERNPRRANLVRRVEDWRWSSVWRRENGNAEQKKLLSAWPVPKPHDYLVWLNSPQTDAEEAALVKSISKNTPFGGDRWVSRVVRDFGLQLTLRSPGRPKFKNGS